MCVYCACECALECVFIVMQMCVGCSCAAHRNGQRMGSQKSIACSNCCSLCFCLFFIIVGIFFFLLVCSFVGIDVSFSLFSLILHAVKCPVCCSTYIQYTLNLFIERV